MQVRGPTRKSVRKSVFNDAGVPPDDVVKKEPPTIYETIYELFEVSFIMGIPLLYLRYFPRKFAFAFGGLCYAIIISFFVFFLADGYETQRTQQFISLSKDAGSCSEVLKPLTSQYLVSDDLHWEGDNDFKYSNALYEIDFINYEANIEEFHSLFGTSFKTLVDTAGERAVDSPAIFNLLMLMHFGRSVPIPAKSSDLMTYQYLGFTGSPSVVYDRANVAAALGSTEGYCLAAPRANFNSLDTKFTVNYFVVDYDDTLFYNTSSAAYNKTDDCVYCNSPLSVSCNDIIKKEKLGYKARHGDLITVTNDVNSISTSTAINYGIITTEALEKSAGPFVLYKDLVMKSMFDTSFDAVQPIRCFSRDTRMNITGIGSEPRFEAIYQKIDVGTETCFTQFGEYLAASTVVHFLSECKDCDGSVGNPDCDVIDILLSTIFFPNSTTPVFDGLIGVTEVLEMYFNYTNTNDFNDATYMAVRNIGFSLGVVQASWFDFCNGECVVMAVNVWDQGQSHDVTKKHFKFTQPHCHDSFSNPDFAVVGDVNKQPAALVEVYYQCTNTPFNAVMQSVGIAAGNTAAFTPLLILVIVFPAVYLYFFMIGVDPPEERYNMLHIEKATRQFIQTMIQANDGTLDCLPKDSLVRQLGRELYIYACFEEGKSIAHLTNMSSLENQHRYKAVDASAVDEAVADPAGDGVVMLEQLDSAAAV